MGIAAGHAGAHLEAEHHVTVALQQLDGGLQVEVAQVVGDAQLVADEVLGGQVQLVGVDEGQHLGVRRRVVDHRPPRQLEGGHPAGAGVDQRRDTHTDADQIRLEAEVAQADEAVGVLVDQARGQQQPVEAAHGRLGVGSDEAAAHGGDAAPADRDIGHGVRSRGGIDDPRTGEDAIHDRET